MDGRTLDGERIVVEHAGILTVLRAGQKRTVRDPNRPRGPQPGDTCFKCGQPGHWFLLLLILLGPMNAPRTAEIEEGKVKVGKE